jgi:hypothetical protein
MYNTDPTIPHDKDFFFLESRNGCLLPARDWARCLFECCNKDQGRNLFFSHLTVKVLVAQGRYCGPIVSETQAVSVSYSGSFWSQMLLCFPLSCGSSPHVKGKVEGEPRWGLS